MGNALRELKVVVTKARQRSLVKGLTGLVKGVEGILPLEQIKGDIARQGHPGGRYYGLDVEAGRVFFESPSGSAMFAEFANADGGYSVQRIGHQSEIVKDYDPVDLEPAGPGDSVTTVHDEKDQDYEEPGMIPSGTPGDQPDDEDEDGFGDERVISRARDMLKLVRSQTR